MDVQRSVATKSAIVIENWNELSQSVSQAKPGSMVFKVTRIYGIHFQQSQQLSFNLLLLFLSI
jgi:hypothetical protein